MNDKATSPCLTSLCSLLVGKLSPADISRAEWPRICDLALQHGVGPFLLWKLAQERADTTNHPPWIDRLKAESRWIALEHIRFDVAWSEVNAALRAAGIPAIWLKGFALSRTAYPLPSLRPMGDLDVLIPFAQREQALEIARTLGYSEGPEQAAALLKRDDRVSAQTAHHYHLQSPQHRVILEIHFQFAKSLLPLELIFPGFDGGSSCRGEKGLLKGGRAMADQNRIVVGIGGIVFAIISEAPQFPSDFRQGDVFGGIAPDGTISNPLEYPLSEVLMVCLLAHQRGLMVHACGISDNGRGFLFAGNSTHGKSTMARIWRDQAVILNDDRIVLRPREWRIWMYGTPWHGDYCGVSPQGIPLDTLFFLRHDSMNQTTPLGVAEAASRLLTRCFPPLWDAAGMEYTLDFCAQIIESVPCYDLGFVPNHEIIDTVRCVK